ncbi:hypothetical protein ACP4OV_005874 [Aristida adscensionis]
MDGDDASDWMAVALTYLALALMYGSLLAMAVSEAAACLGRWRDRRRRALAADRLLDAVPDAAYHPLPSADDEAAAADGDGGCVVCMAEYASGEARLALPGCGHAFHRGCIAAWLRQGAAGTCPICRATVDVPPPEHCTAAPTPAEDMV